MSLKNTVAVERRMDLASLFCMIGRHGPAVALAVIAMASVLAGIIIYRTVRGKRRKATAAAADSDGESPGAERDASVKRPEEPHSSAESTDASDEVSSDVKEDADPIHLKIRHRGAAAAAAAAEKKLPSYFSSNSNIQVPEYKRTTTDDSEACAQEASQSLKSDTYTEAEMLVDCHQAPDDITEDVTEEVQDNDSCWKEPEAIHVRSREEEEEVLKVKSQDVTTRHEKDKSVQNEQTSHMGENGDDDTLQEEKNTLKTNSMEFKMEEPVIYMEDVPLPCVCHGKDEKFEEENPDSIDCSTYLSNNHISQEEKTKNDCEEAEEECVNSQQAEMWSSTSEQEANLQSTQCDHVTDMVTPPIQEENGGLTAEVIEEVVDEDHLDKVRPLKFDNHSPQVEEKEVEIEQKEENGLDQEDGVLYNGTDQVKEKMLTTDNVACSGDHDSSSHDHGVTTDATAQISSIADFPDLVSDSQQPPEEDKRALSPDEDTDSIILGSQMPSHETENNANGTAAVLTEEYMHDPHVQSIYKDKQSVQTVKVSDKASLAADPDTVKKITASIIVEEIYCPHMPSICQDQQSDRMENDESVAPNCDNATITSPITSEETPYLDTLSSSPDQQSDQMKNNEDFTTGAAAVMTEDMNRPMCQIHLPSFEQSDLKDSDLLSPGVGEESGISSMAVSPDLQDAEFGVTVGNMPLMDCDLLSERQTEAKNRLFADDVAVSVTNEDTAGTVFGPYPSRQSQPPHSVHTEWTNESFAANEDTFGHDIEDSYHRAMDQFMAQIAASVTSFTDELKKQTDMTAVVEVIEKKAGVSDEKKKETKAEKEEEEDYEKTEISIMEATMDNNEWITDSNYQVLPWMNLSAPSFAQDATKTSAPPTEECCHVTETTCIDATDIPPSTEVKQTSTLSPVDENLESNKKVVAVQPMPQNVNVTFRIHYRTQSPYQTVAVTGNQEEMGNWKGFIPLERAKDGHWATVVSLPAESHVEWKFVVLDKGEVCRWEECGNRLLDTGYGDDLLVHKWWGVL